ncbi:CPBP family intramembrane glutamic endopeptidase [uncultured Microbacterium sp.]|uniref:CPBP family intramembrane glutamic endopeptidase n=1 Tax=uncultured Microbacterium sp. TaxID=191216 RepID=UPI0026363EDD|nr:CPBP family intramembrane glutamic endopeptidase [uncultured Microbacterium sp.]
MTTTPGFGSGSSSFYRRPGVALAVAAISLAGSAVLTLTGPQVRGPVGEWPAWLGIAVDYLVTLGPLLAGALVAARLGGPALARALGIRFAPIDLLLGALVAIIVRAVVEVMTPTTGSLIPPFADADADRLAGTALAVIAAVLFAPVVEEVFFRGALQRALQALVGPGGVGATLAIAVSTAGFTLMHALPYGATVPVAALLPPILIGVGAGVLTVVTGRISAGLVTHVLFNLTGVVLLLV